MSIISKNRDQLYGTFMEAGREYMMGKLDMKNIEAALNEWSASSVLLPHERLDAIRRGSEQAIENGEALASRIQPRQDIATIDAIYNHERKSTKARVHEYKLPKKMRLAKGLSEQQKMLMLDIKRSS